jgi:hypothetical protein
MQLLSEIELPLHVPKFKPPNRDELSIPGHETMKGIYTGTPGTAKLTAAALAHAGARILIPSIHHQQQPRPANLRLRMKTHQPP